MALLQVLCIAFFLLAARVSSDSCVSKPCGSDYQVTSWNPVREGSNNVYYYQVKTDGCVGVVFTDVLVQTSLTCKSCATVTCYNSNWDSVRCSYTYAWETSDSFLSSKGVAVTSGLKLTVSSSTTAIYFSINVPYSTSTSAQGKLYTKGNSWTSCTVTTPVCTVSTPAPTPAPTCPPCPGSCYRESAPVYPNCACSNCTNCATNTYETKACTATSNRVCSPCTNCVTGSTYQTGACSSTANRVCTSCSPCTGSTYMSSACTTTSNTVCSPCANCTGSTWMSGSCSTTSNAVCSPCMTCVAGQYQSQACSNTHNRICTNCQQCVANMTYLTAACTGTTNTQCSSCSQCAAGQYESRACTTTQNRLCSNCTTCVAGQYESVPCTNGHNRVCTTCQQCAANTYQTVACIGTTPAQCSTCNTCVAGQYESVSCTNFHNRICTTCNQCQNGQYASVPCSQYNNTQCSSCNTCIAGQYESVSCTNLHNRICTTCSQCQEGHYVAAPCSATQDTQCSPCTPCAEGQMTISACSSTSNAVCSNCTTCEAGSFASTPCNGESDTVCQQCSSCSADEIVLYPCNATNDVVCIPCPYCANCTAIPNSHLSNNGLNCSCNEGYTEQNSEGGQQCVSTPCCDDCQSCGFNRSVACANPDPDLCDYSCRINNNTCGLGVTASQTGYTINFNNVTYDNDCCPSANVDCSCFNYTLASSGITLDDFILGISCGISQCAQFVTPPCFDYVTKDGNPTNAILNTQASGATTPNPNTQVFGIELPSLGITADYSYVVFVFQGHLNVSVLPITIGASGQSSESEQDACLITSIAGPDCVDCTTNPTGTFAMPKTLQSVPTAKEESARRSFFGRKIRN